MNSSNQPIQKEVEIIQAFTKEQNGQWDLQSSGEENLCCP